jgi:hypothetical protein
MSSAFRRLPWWLRLGAAYLSLAALLGLLIACLALAFCALFGRCEQQHVMLGCTAFLFALPISAVAATRLLDEIFFALNDPERPAVQAREREAIEHVLRRLRQVQDE